MSTKYYLIGRHQVSEEISRSERRNAKMIQEKQEVHLPELIESDENFSWHLSTTEVVNKTSINCGFGSICLTFGISSSRMKRFNESSKKRRIVRKTRMMRTRRRRMLASYFRLLFSLEIFKEKETETKGERRTR